MVSLSYICERGHPYVNKYLIIPLREPGDVAVGGGAVLEGDLAAEGPADPVAGAVHVHRRLLGLGLAHVPPGLALVARGLPLV